MTDCYWHTGRRLWSLRERGRVVAHLPRVCLDHVTLTVRESGVARIRLRGQREVVAWATGTNRRHAWRGGGGVQILFRPFVRPNFHTPEGVTLTACFVLHLEPDGTAWAVPNAADRGRIEAGREAARPGPE